MVEISLNPEEEIVLVDTHAMLMANKMALPCSVYLTNQRVVILRHESDTVGFLAKAILPFTQEKVVLDIKLEDLKEFKEIKVGFGRFIYIESVNGQQGRVLSDKKAEFLELLVDDQ
jgi:hypothetical protein